MKIDSLPGVYDREQIVGLLETISFNNLEKSIIIKLTVSPRQHNYINLFQYGMSCEEKKMQVVLVHVK